jgi:ArsR family transcriptional regulator
MKDSVIRSRPPRRAVPGAIAAGVFDLSVHFEGLANPTRLAIVEILARRGEVRVSELAELCMVSQPRMSWHLRTLRHAQVVSTRRDGREVFCRLDREAIDRNLRSFVQILGAGADPKGAAESSRTSEALPAPVSEGVS